MNTRQKKALYESIMKNVAKQVKKALNETVQPGVSSSQLLRLIDQVIEKRKEFDMGPYGKSHDVHAEIKKHQYYTKNVWPLLSVIYEQYCSMNPAGDPETYVRFFKQLSEEQFSVLANAVLQKMLTNDYLIELAEENFLEKNDWERPDQESRYITTQGMESQEDYDDNNILWDFDYYWRAECDDFFISDDGDLENIYKNPDVWVNSLSVQATVKSEDGEDLYTSPYVDDYFCELGALNV